jgi:DNA-binding CsgD family transcriptional regulator
MSQLTARQLQILAFTADGHTNAWIAHTTGLSIHTVKAHLHEAYARLHARDRAHAVTLAHRAGLLDLTGPTATVRSAA